MHFGPMPRAGDAQTLLQEPHPSLTFTIALLKALLGHIPLRVEHEHPRIWDAPDPVLFGNAIGSMVLVDIFVQQAEGADNFAALIGEERVRDPVPGSEIA